MLCKYKSVFLIIFLITFSIGICSCSKEKHHYVSAGVYHWKTVFNPDNEEKEWLKENHINRLYLRMFDVDWNESVKGPVPVGDVEIKENKLQGLEIIPAVFITNRTLLNIADSSLNNLASKIVKKIFSKMENSALPKFHELQMDCDWSEKTRDKYFHLIRSIKQYSRCETISATIRLHQIKYFKRTGVPPVDRGMLMFYNMGSVDNILVRNSIFDIETAKKYLYNFDKYPLKLDVALPAFSWGALFRKEKLISLINDIDKEQLTAAGKFKELTPNQYACTSPVVINGIQYFENDLIRIEAVNTGMTESAAELVSKYIREDKFTVALYHLNKEVVRKYEKTKLENIYSHFN